MPVNSTYGKQVNTYLPNDVYNGIVNLCREMGGLAPSAFIRAVLIKVTDGGKVNPLANSEMQMLSLARSPNTKPLPYAGAKAEHDAKVKSVVAELLEGMLPTIQANAEAIIEAKEHEANEQAMLSEEYDPMLDEYVPVKYDGAGWGKPT